MGVSVADGNVSKQQNITIVPRSFSFSKGTPPLLNTKNVALIVIHETSISSASVETIHQNHMKSQDGGLDGRGIAFNFYIRKNGAVYEGRGFTFEGCHAIGLNSSSIGIALEGDFSRETPTVAQMGALANLSMYCFSKLPSLRMSTDRVRAHSTGSRACPGKNFSMTSLKNALQSKINALVSVDSDWTGNGLGMDSNKFGTHVVQSSMRSIADIAKYLGVTKDSILLLNNLSPTTKELAPGRIIYYPASTITKIVSGTLVTTTPIMQHYAGTADIIVKRADEDILMLGELDVPKGSLSASSVAVEGAKKVAIPRGNPVIVGSKATKRGRIDHLKFNNTYKKMRLYVETDKELIAWQFMIDPSSSSETRSRRLMDIYTKNGAIIADGGRELIPKSLNGYLLDYNGKSEKLEFIKFYENYISSGAYKAIYMDMMGVVSLIEIRSVSLTEDSNHSVLKQYSMSIVVIKDDIGSSEPYPLVGSLQSSAASTATNSSLTTKMPKQVAVAMGLDV